MTRKRRIQKILHQAGYEVTRQPIGGIDCLVIRPIARVYTRRNKPDISVPKTIPVKVVPS